MRLSKANKERLDRLMSAVIDCDYTIKRIKKEGKQSELENWINYRNDLLNTANAVKNGKSLNI